MKSKLLSKSENVHKGLFTGEFSMDSTVKEMGELDNTETTADKADGADSQGMDMGTTGRRRAQIQMDFIRRGSDRTLGGTVPAELHHIMEVAEVETGVMGEEDGNMNTRTSGREEGAVDSTKEVWM